jgi:hypothetical protein
MPRGIPNAKRDDTGMRYTTFTVPLASVDHPNSLNIADRHVERIPNIWERHT